MILSLTLAKLGTHMERAQIHRVCVQPGDAVRPGSALLELRVDLGAAAAQDCPPLFYYRLVATESATVRFSELKPDDEVEVGARLLLLSSTHDEPLGPPARPLRCTAIGIHVDAFPG